LEDERLKGLAARLTASVDKQLGDAEDDSPARIQLTMSDGSIIERRKDFGSGSNTNPMSAQQMEDKFFDCATQVIDRERAQRISEFVKAMPQKSSFADFWPLLRTS
jgi:2-methylcitrate dehydratase PrpD